MRCGEGDGWAIPATQGESDINLQVLAILLQIIVANMLLINIIHHW